MKAFPVPENLIKPVGRRTLAQKIVNQFTELVMKGVWKPGDIIPTEKELSTWFEVGRSTIREALQSLVVLGILETTSRGRVIVQEPNSELLSGAFRWGLILGKHNLTDLNEVRINTEVECAGLAAVRRDEEDAHELQSIFEKMILHEADEKSYIEYDNLFHQKVAESSKNVIYANLVSTIQSLVRLWFPASYIKLDTIERSKEEHRLILESIQSQNKEMAQEKMREHLLSSYKRLHEVFDKHEGSQI